MSPFVAEMITEAIARIRQYSNERDQLLKAKERIKELEKLIAEAEAHKAELEDKHDSK